MYGPGSGYPAAGRAIVSYMVKGEGVLSPFIPVEMERVGSDPSIAFKGQRSAYFKEAKFTPTDTYDFAKLKPGNIIEGPAIIEAEETTIVVPPAFRAELDGYLNTIIEEK